MNRCLRTGNSRCSQLILKFFETEAQVQIAQPLKLQYSKIQQEQQWVNQVDIHNGGRYQQQWLRFARVTQSEKLTQSVPRINNQIRAKEVRLKLDDGETQVMSTSNAIILAKEKDMDLIETVPHTSPPVCIIMEFNKFRYELQKKEKEMKKNLAERTLKEKELHLTYNISPHDLEVKLKKLKELLDHGSKVKIVIKTGKNPKIQPIVDLFVKIHESHSEDCIFSLVPKSYLNQPVEVYIVQQKALAAAKEKLKSYSREDVEDHLWRLEKRRQMEAQGFLSTGNPETTPVEKVK